MPLAIRNKLPKDSAFCIVWKRGQDAPIESKYAVIETTSKDKNKEKEKEKEKEKSEHEKNLPANQSMVVWSEPEIMTMNCVLIKSKANDKFMSKPCRVLLKQVHKDHTHSSTVGLANLDLKDYVLCEQPTSIDIRFMKCNIANIYLKATMNVTPIDNESDGEESFSPKSMRTVIEADRENMDWDDTTSLPTSSPEEDCSCADDDTKNNEYSSDHIDGIRNPQYTIRDAIVLSTSEQPTILPFNGGRNVAKKRRRTGTTILPNELSLLDENTESVPKTMSSMHKRSYSVGQISMADLIRQCAQLEAKLKIVQNDNEELKTELEEKNDQYDALLSKYKELEKEHKTKDSVLEKSYHSLKSQLSDAENQCIEHETEIKNIKAENTDLKEKIAQSNKKYNDLLFTLNASKSELRKKIAELARQNDDLESTLLMLRNSWNETGTVMESQVLVCNNKVEQLNQELSNLQTKYTNTQQMVEKIQQEKLQIHKEKSDLECKCASHNVELAHLQTQLNKARLHLDKIRSWVLDLLQQGMIATNEEDDNGIDIINEILQYGSIENLMSQLKEIHDKNNEVSPSMDSMAPRNNQDENNTDPHNIQVKQIARRVPSVTRIESVKHISK